MQISPLQQASAENLKENLETGLKQVPAELLSIIPESVWITLTLDQKKDILRQHNLLEKYVKPVNPQSALENTGTTNTPVEEKNPVIVEEEQKLERNKDFEEALNELKNIDIETEKSNENGVAVVSKEELDRIEEENAKKANTGNYKFFGYQPSKQTFEDARKISDEGSVSESKTWAATLIAKIFSLFQ